MIKFTVVTCTYNAERVLQRTLYSVNKQTYCNIEHLIIDGVSKDKTLAMVRAYQNRAKAGENAHEIVVYSEPDKGLYDAMNKGIDRATGDYLVFLNAGDVFPSDDTLEYVEGCVGEGENLPGVLYGDTDIVNDEGRFLRHRRLSPPEKLNWRSFKWGMLVCHQSFYARTDIARPAMLDYKTLIDAESMYNTPPCYTIYMMGLVLKWIETEVGGLANMEARNNAKAKLLYDYLDGSSFFSNPVNKPDRSIMNVTFTSPSPELDKKFCAEAAAAGFVNLKGHRSVGGMRASIYNAMPAEGVEKLVEFMKQFEADNA